MHFEFRLIIEAALVEVRDLLSVRLERDLALDELASLEVEIATPPSSSKGRLCTNAPFAVAAYCNGDAGKTLWQPAEVAGLMIDALGRVEVPAKMYFDCFIGGAGHINAEINPALGPVMLRSMNEGSIFPLHDRPSLFSAGQQSDILAGKQIPEYQRALEDWWTVIGLSQSTDSELLAVISEAEAEGPKSSAARMQLLSLLADTQLDAGAFLGGVGGKENIPWYLARFLANSLSYLERLGFASDRAGSSLDCGLWCAPAIETVLCTRYEFQRAASAREPARLMKHLLSCIHGFYRYYNHPSFRCVDLANPEKELVLNLSRALNRIVNQGVRILGLL